MSDTEIVAARPTEDAPVALVAKGDSLLTYRQARETPCMTCTTSPCCTYLLLRDFKIDTLMDVDYAFFLLNFDGIVLSLEKGRKVDVYLYQPCGNLDVESGLCQVHSTGLQPAVCIHYSAYTCSYRHTFTTDLHADKPLLNSARMAWLADQIAFDDGRKVAAFPDWDDVLEGFSSIPMERKPASPPGPDPMLEEWRSIVLSAKGAVEDRPRHLHRFGDPEVTEPCQGCDAWCCKTLVFDRGLPADASQIEFLRYCIGFPSVEIGVAAEGWAVIVHTRCRHLVGNRCSVYGTDERPLRCSSYDALDCSYRGHFGVPRPDDIVRVTRSQFATLADSVAFDERGRVVAIPPVNVLRNRIEGAERAGARPVGITQG